MNDILVLNIASKAVNEYPFGTKIFETLRQPSQNSKNIFPKAVNCSLVSFHLKRNEFLLFE
jgi:hypothetical protein